MAKPKLTRLEAAEIALQLLKHNDKKKRISKCVGRSRYVKCITDANKCYLCDETRCLENAHVIPVAIYAEAEQVDVRPPYIDEVIKLCPTHHKCYDKFQLNEKEKQIMRDSVKNYHVLELVLKHMEVIPGASNKAKERLDRSLEIAWKWWKEYRYAHK